MKSALLKFIYSILLFFYIYNIDFIALPIKTRSIIAVFGAVIFIPCILYYKLLPKLSHIIYHYFGYAVIIPIITIITIIINRGDDYYFIKYFVTLSIIFFSSFFIYICMKMGGLYSISHLIDVFTYAISMQVIISGLMYFSPHFNNFIQNIIYNEYIKEELIGENNRFIGIGLHFFNSGAMCGVALLLLTIKLINKDNTHILDFLLFLFISIGGLFIARTVLIGLLNSLFIIIVYGSMKKWISLFVISSIIVFYIIYLFSSIGINRNQEYSNLYEHAFELFINEGNDDSFSTSSTNSLMEMYKNIPKNLSTKTIIIGDGKRIDEYGNYYMETDIGYLRHIFYFGIFGLLSLLLFEFIVAKMSFIKINLKIPIISIMFLYFLIINLKGEWMLSLALTPFLFLYVENNSKIINS